MVEDEELQLFIRTHYAIYWKQSLRPVLSGSEIKFPRVKVYEKKRLTLLEKLRYYIQDFRLWLTDRNEGI